MSSTDVSATTERIAARQLGFASADQEARLAEVPVVGSLPRWLSGTLLRTGPAKFELERQRLRHWFDGMAMLHRFSFSDGRVTYANRFLESRAYRTTRADGRLAVAEFATDPCRTIFKRTAAMFSPDFTDNCTINVARVGETFFAMTETPMPVSFDPETLDALGVAYEPPGHHATAHPHADPATGVFLNHAVHFGPRSEYRFFSWLGDRRPEILVRHRTREPAYVHSFGLSERYLVLLETPLKLNLRRLISSGGLFIEGFKWREGDSCRFLLFDRRTADLVRTVEAPPFFAFHHVNAFDDGDEVVVDVVAFEDASVIDRLFLDNLRGADPQLPLSWPRRYRLDLRAGTCDVRTLYEPGLELPRINDAYNARPYRYLYGAGVRPESQHDGLSDEWFNRLAKVDVESGASAVWEQDGLYPGEPVFVGRPGATSEDDGVILSVVLDAPNERSLLLVLDASDFREVARAEVAHPIPFGIHGGFFPQAAVGDGAAS